MKSGPKSTESRQVPGITPLSLAWLGLIALLTAGATYVLLARQSPDPQSVEALAATLELAKTESGGGQATAEGAETAEAADQADAMGTGSGGSDGNEARVPAATEAETAGGTAAPGSGAAAGSEAQAEASGDEPPASPVLAPEQTALAEGAEQPAWQRYAAAYPVDGDVPRIAVVLTGLGFSKAATEAAIEQLPAGVTLSFTPYAQQLDQWIARARSNGHEVMLDLPMEPVTYPHDDPGPQTLLTELDDLENQQRLRWVLSRAQGYVGLAGSMGSRFAGSEPNLKPILTELKELGLMYLDNRASHDSVAGRVAVELSLPHAVNDRTLDEDGAGHLTIDARLAQVERVALSGGTSVAMGRPYPATIERLREWVRTLESRGFTLVPITALAERQLQ